MKWIKIIPKIELLVLVLLIATFIIPPPLVEAISGSEFRADRIIDDSIFFDQNSMNAGQIQAFLNAKMPVCDTWHATSGGNTPPFICLKEYSQTISGRATDSYCEGSVSGGLKSAAQIIYDVAQACGISPKVLIVLLQKEQSLVTDSWPWTSQYDRATGYYCPDDPSRPGWCNPEYAGFFNQVWYAARQFQRYIKQPGSFNYAANRTSFVPYQANNPGCGGTNITIRNHATAALYNYTPYQPNAAALNNLYGTGDGCSAYGNRNFWRLFNDWFGTTTGDSPNYIWNFETLDGSAQGVSTNSADVGNYPYSININGDIHNFYYDIQNGNLKHSWIASGTWNFETLDGAGGTGGRIDSDVGGFSKALFHNNQIYIFYRDFQKGDLRMANYAESTGWNFETLDGAGGTGGRIDTDMGWDIDATNDGTSLHVFYSDAVGGNLRHAWKTTGNWNFETLDGDTNSVTRRPGNIGQGIKSQFLGNSIHLFYYDASSTNLVHAWIDPASGWRFEYLDGSPQSISGFNARIGISPSFIYVNNSIHAYYYDIDRGALRHAWFDPASGWRFEHLDGIPGAISKYSALVGLRSSVVMEGPVMNVFYYNGTNQAIRHAWHDNTGWHFVNLDGGPSSVGASNSTIGEHFSTILYGNNVQVFYFDGTNQTLKHAWGAPR